MTERIDMPPNGAIERSASRWLARLDRGDLSAEEQATFEAWLRADPRHETVYRALAAAWQQLDGLQTLSTGPDETIDPDALGTDVLGPEVLHRQQRFSARAIALAAACVAALALLVTFIGWPPRTAHEKPPSSAQVDTRHYATPVGGHERVTLLDGSIAELNTDTRLHATVSDTERRIDLERGEASFEVVADPRRPFRVVAAHLTVRALGTVFNVERHSTLGAAQRGETQSPDTQRSNSDLQTFGTQELIEVLVVEGEVALGATTLHAGELALSTATHLEVRALPAERLERQLAWKRGMLVFEDVTLLEAAQEFNRYNTRRLIVSDAAIGSLRIGGYFRANNVEGFVRVLEEHFAIHAMREATQIRLTAGTAPRKD